MSAQSPIASVPPGPDAPLLVFNSYSRKDQKWLDLLLDHLTPLERGGTIRLWVDKGKIEFGDRYNDEIATAIDTCGAAILLVSPFFHNSSFIQEKELPRLLCRADAKEIRLYWLLVSDCLLADDLADTYHCANDSQMALDAMSEAQVNKVLANLTRDLKKHALQAKSAPGNKQTASEVAEQKKMPPIELPKPVRRELPRVGRNDLCPCGSNKRFKECCGKL